MNSHINFDTLMEKSKANFRFAELNDVPALMDLYRQFYEEAVYKDFLPYAPERVRNSVSDGIERDWRPHIVAIVQGRIVGFISYILDHSFSEQPCQVMHELYVLPAFRRSALGRGLVGLAILEGRNAGAGAIHAPVASGMIEQKTLFNLFRKAGFEMFGYMMRKKL